MRRFFLSFCLMALNAQAQDLAVTLDQVRVYADLRQGALEDVPASVTVLDEKALQARAQNHLQDALGSIANLNWQAGSSRPRYFQIRGIGEDSQYLGAPNPSVGFLVDDIDFSGLGGLASTFDVERIEVLRGPQGTRYGANALAGLISVKSQDPGDALELKHSLTLGSDDHAAIGQVLSGPVSDSFGLRLAAQKSVQDGFRRNVFLNRDDTNARDESLLRLVAKWQPSSAFRLRTSAFLVNQANGYDGFSIDNSRVTQSDQPGRDAQFSRALSTRAEFDTASGISLTALLSAARSESEASFDGDWGNDAFWGVNAPYDFFSDTDRVRNTRSIELRAQANFDALAWVLGAYGLNLDEDLSQRDRFNGEPSYALDSDYGSQNRAVFGELAFDFGARDQLVVGARFEQRQARYTDSEALRFDPNENLWGGSISWLRRELIGRSTGYVTVARGYKAGGFNLGGNIPVARRQFDAERLLNLEIGLKGSNAAGNLSGTLALFNSWRRDQQVATSFQSDPTDPLTFVFFTDNAARGDNRGLEASANYRINHAFALDASLGLLNTKIEQCVCGTRILNGRDQANAPKVTAALGVDWSSARGFFGRVELTHRGSYYFSDSHDQRARAASFVNARWGYGNERWTASVWARNLTNTEHAIRGFFFGNEPPDFPDRLYLQRGDPRWVGVSLELSL